jgi:hypothetical protein
MRLDHYDNSDFTRGASFMKEGLWWVVRSLFFAPWLSIPIVSPKVEA